MERLVKISLESWVRLCQDGEGGANKVAFSRRAFPSNFNWLDDSFRRRIEEAGEKEEEEEEKKEKEGDERRSVI